MGQDIVKTHKRLLEMAQEIKNIFEENNITYSITFGTLIGAVRHHGFIPWDDDFDFIIFKNEYKKAIDALRKKLPSDFFLEDSISEPLFFHAWPHVKDLNSIASRELYPNDGLYSHKGLSVDLYVADIVYERDIELFSLREKLEYHKRLHSVGILSDKEFKSFQEKTEKEILQEEAKNQNTPSGDKQLFLALPKRYRQIPMKDFFPLKQYVFEGVYFAGPDNADKILSRIYGDYMTLPPVEDRHPHYDNVLFLN